MNKAITKTKAKTYPVICPASLRVGQTTFFTSRTESRPKAMSYVPGSDVKNNATAATINASNAATRTHRSCCAR